MSDYPWWWRSLPACDPRRDAPLDAHLETQSFAEFPWIDKPSDLYVDWDEYFAVSEQIWAVRERLA